MNYNLFQILIMMVCNTLLENGTRDKDNFV